MATSTSNFVSNKEQLVFVHNIKNEETDAVARAINMKPKRRDLCRTLLQFQMDGYLCDTELVGEGGRIKVHGAVLAAASEVFKSSIESHDEPVAQCLVLPGIDVDVLNAIVHCAYTGDVIVPPKYATSDGIAMMFNILVDLGLSVPDCSPISIATKDETNHLTDFELQSCGNNHEVDHDSKHLSLEYTSTSETDPVQATNNVEECSGAEETELLEIAGAVEMDEHQLMEDLKASTEVAPAAKRLTLKCMRTHPRKSDKRRVTKSDCKNAEIDVVIKQTPDAVHETSTENLVYLCEECGKGFPNSFALGRHVKLHAGDKHPFVCQYCGEEFRMAHWLKRHMLRHTGTRQNLCPLCGDVFLTLFQLRNHTRTHHPDHADTESSLSSEFKPYLCPKCALSFVSREELLAHVETHGETTMHSSIADDQPAGNSDENCSGGGSKAVGGNRRKRRRIFERPYACTTCGLRFSSKLTLGIHKQQWHADRFSTFCMICNQDFADPESLAQHVEKHSNEFPFHCNRCSRGFPYQHLLEEHMARHDGIRPHICPICNRGFSYAVGLTRHKRTHSGERPYSCHVCGKQLRESGHLKRHMRVHTGEKPYSCSFCNKSYKVLADVRIHLNNVHNIELPCFNGQRPKPISRRKQKGRKMVSALRIIKPDVDA